MNPIPPWGCPWHGLVTDYKLTTASGKVMDYPGRVNPGEVWRCGSNSLIAHPNAPKDERTAEQKATDEKAGREWKNTAILAGVGILHGRNLGDGNWLYIDPKGHTWLVRTGFEGAVALPIKNVEVILTRFGVLSGKPKSYSYTVALPDNMLGQSTPAVTDPNGFESLGSLIFRRFDTNKTGSRSIFNIGVYRLVTPRFGDSYVPADNAAFGDCPLGWLEITISGEGAEAKIGVTILRSRAQTLGSLTDSGSTPEPVQIAFKHDTQTVDTRAPFPTCTGRMTQTTTANFLVGEIPAAGSEDFTALGGAFIYTGTLRKSITGRVIGMYYNEDDTASVVTVNLTYTAEVDAPTPSASINSRHVVITENQGAAGDRCNVVVTVPSYSEVALKREAKSKETMRLELMRDGEVIDSHEEVVTQSVTVEHTFKGTKGRFQIDEALTVYSSKNTYTNGGTYSSESKPTNVTGTLFWEFDVLRAGAVRVDGMRVLIPAISASEWPFSPNPGKLEVAPRRFSNRLYGLFVRKGSTVEFTVNGVPTGTPPIPPLRNEGVAADVYSTIYGSWNPQTKQALISTDPVYWV
ncbi:MULTISPECIES: hypothetical protein [unclassified Pseudomonas]|uniref:hypothetical protein n=1 Tax=unclassified Pseudomonas TaxID=196821 RepID=UPI001C60B081|nr:MULTISPECIES: hypothetical protein [unclassified Pseudomonas]MBW5416105.1 hypothetical protein [Pseudomonas sp. MAG002Y]